MYQLLQKYFNILTTSADVLLSSDLSHTKFEFLSQHFPRMWLKDRSLTSLSLISSSVLTGYFDRAVAHMCHFATPDQIF